MALKFEMVLEMAELILKQWMVLNLVVLKLVQEIDFKPEELLTLIQEMDFKLEELMTLIMVVEVKEQIKVFQIL